MRTMLKMSNHVITKLKVGSDWIVLLRPDEKSDDQNIIRLSEKGEVVWRVQRSDPYTGSDAWRSVAFTYLGMSPQGKIIGGSFNSFNYEIDFETGKLSNPELVK